MPSRGPIGRGQPWDIYLTATYALLVTLSTVTLGGNMFASLLILFLPGYMITCALFPRAADVSWLERAGLSLILSVALSGLLGFALSLTDFGIARNSVAISLGVFTCGTGTLAYFRRISVRPEERLNPVHLLESLGWRRLSLRSRGVVVTLATMTIIVALIFALVLSAPIQGAHFTEFYLLGPKGSLSEYPTRLNVSEPGTVVVGLTNHEGVSVNYTIWADLVGLRQVPNTTSGGNTTILENVTTLWWFNVSVARDDNWTHPYTFSIPYAGAWRIEFSLFKDGDLAIVYRHAYLDVIVS